MDRGERPNTKSQISQPQTGSEGQHHYHHHYHHHYFSENEKPGVAKDPDIRWSSQTPTNEVEASVSTDPHIEADDAIQKLISRRPESAEILEVPGQKEAVEEYKQFLQLNPNTPEDGAVRAEIVKLGGEPPPKVAPDPLPPLPKGQAYA